jgi:hypothetical protein
MIGECHVLFSDHILLNRETASIRFEMVAPIKINPAVHNMVMAITFCENAAIGMRTPMNIPNTIPNPCVIGGRLVFATRMAQCLTSSLVSWMLTLIDFELLFPVISLL